MGDCARAQSLGLFADLAPVGLREPPSGPQCHVFLSCSHQLGSATVRP